MSIIELDGVVDDFFSSRHFRYGMPPCLAQVITFGNTGEYKKEGNKPSPLVNTS